MAEQSQEEKQRIMMDAVGQMKGHTAPSLSQICGAIADNRGEMAGSGTIIELRGKPYLLTAEHVAARLFAQNTDGSRKYPSGLCHSVGNDQRMVYITNPWHAWPDSKDIAATRLDAEMLHGTTVAPLKATRFARNTDDLNYDLYFVHGWPGKLSRFTTFFDRGVTSTSQPYGGWLTDDTDWPDFDPKVHLAITYPMTDLIDERGNTANLAYPDGVSGSLLWKTNRVGAGAAWTPDMATVVGLIHRFDPVKQCLLATRIEYLKGFLLFMLRTESAFFRWNNRGRPQGDDWADWFAVEAEVRRL